MAALRGYRRLPFAADNVPGAYVEAVIARMRDAHVLRTYDFVDVIDRSKSIGWQVKSTLAATPVTWKRAKIPDALRLIEESRSGDERDLQALGDAIIHFCNEHARESMRLYNLTTIGYARVCVTKREIIYFERELVSRTSDSVFDPSQFTWRWSLQKAAGRKEQLSALHGIHLPSNSKWFAWHGLGENQLHFSGERAWWPGREDPNSVRSMIPDRDVKITFDEFVEWVTSREFALAESDDGLF